MKDGPSAFENRIDTKLLINHGYIEPRAFLEACASKIAAIIEKWLSEFSSIKVYFIFAAIYEIREEEEEVKSIYSKTIVLLKKHWLPRREKKSLWKWYRRVALPDLLRRIDDFEANGSGYVLRDILNVSVNMNMYDPLHGGTFFLLPREIRYKNAVMNIKSKDEYCFLWSITAALYTEKFENSNINQFKGKKREEVYKLFIKRFPLWASRFDFPMGIHKIAKFEKCYNISINVYTLRKGAIVP